MSKAKIGKPFSLLCRSISFLVNSHVTTVLNKENNSIKGSHSLRAAAMCLNTSHIMLKQTNYIKVYI
jgi:hypothetical protein